MKTAEPAIWPQRHAFRDCALLPVYGRQVLAALRADPGYDTPTLVLRLLTRGLYDLVRPVLPLGWRRWLRRLSSQRGGGREASGRGGTGPAVNIVINMLRAIKPFYPTFNHFLVETNRCRAANPPLSRLSAQPTPQNASSRLPVVSGREVTGIALRDLDPAYCLPLNSEDRSGIFRVKEVARHSGAAATAAVSAARPCLADRPTPGRQPRLREAPVVRFSSEYIGIFPH